MVRLVLAGTTFDMGPPIGPEQQDRDGVTITQWLSGPSWQAVNPSTWAKISELLAQARPDPAALHTIHWELAPFWCRECNQCYCGDHWHPYVLMDEGFYDCTDGVCPAGHRQTLDD